MLRMGHKTGQQGISDGNPLDKVMAYPAIYVSNKLMSKKVS